MKTMFRQGDVLIVRVEGETPVATGAPISRDNGRIVLAYGESTGHAHAIAAHGAELFESLDAHEKVVDDVWARSARILRVYDDSGVDLQHEEHETIHLPPGTYQVTRQREYAPGPPKWQMVGD